MDPRFLIFAVLVTLPIAAQPVQSSCSGATCTFTLNFDDGYANLANITAAPYSGQMQYGNSRTLPNGTHMSNQSSGPMIYRDSKGRVRTERHVFSQAQTGRPVSPDDFIIAEIHDPVAGFEYVLDPINHVAHRRPFKPESTWKWNPSQITNMQADPQGSAGPNSTVQFLGTRTISGVLAYGKKTTWTRTTPGGQSITQIDEEWLDPASGETLLRRNGPNGNDSTVTQANYSNTEPDASLFQIPDGYQTMDETGSFQVIHPHTGPGSSGSGVRGLQLTRSCEENTCSVTVDPGTAPVNVAVTGAPYSGHLIFTNVAANGKPFSASPNGTGEYRDSYGRTRADPAPINRGGNAAKQPLVKIEDPVAGFFYILDPASQAAYRIKAAFRSYPFQPNENIAQQAGKFAAPNGRTETVENLGPQTISGVTAIGQRQTATYPPGIYNQNDKEIVTVNERWFDPKTGVTILTKNTGLNANMVTNSMPDYEEGDPDASLFQIPAGYKIVDESGPFTIGTPAP